MEFVRAAYKMQLRTGLLSSLLVVTDADSKFKKEFIEMCVFY